MEDYLARRNELIARDRALRPDAAVGSTSTDELQADKILRSIRSAEAETIWSPKREVRHVHGSSRMFPGMEFLTGTWPDFSLRLLLTRSQLVKPF